MEQAALQLAIPARLAEEVEVLCWGINRLERLEREEKVGVNLRPETEEKPRGRTQREQRAVLRKALGLSPYDLN